jgi:hypothetical protein
MAHIVGMEEYYIAVFINFWDHFVTTSQWGAISYQDVTIKNGKCSPKL